MERLVVVDSKDRDMNVYPEGNNYVIHLSSHIKNISRVDLVSARLPNTIYNLTSTSNVMTVGTSNISLTAGFYGAGGISMALTSAGLTTAYLSSEGKFMFSSVSPFNINVTSLEFAIMLGMNLNYIYSGTLATSTDPAYNGQYILRSDKIVNLSINEFVYLDIDELRTPSHVSTGSLVAGTDTVTGSNAGRSFAPIIMDVGSACIKNFKETEYKISVTYPEPIGTLSRLTVRWYDRNGSLLNFRGLETNAFVLRIHTEREIRLPTLPPIEEVEMKRFVEAVQIEKPREKRRIPWTLIAVLILLGFFAYFNLSRRNVN